MLIRHAMIPGETGFVMQDVRLQDGRVTHVAGEIAPCAGERTLEMQGDYLLPGFVDVHVHAFRGQDAMQGEAAVRHMARELYREGVAAFLPTTMSAEAEATQQAVAGIRAVMDHPEPRGARAAGAHMEAPFLNPERCGAQRAECLCSPDWETFLRLCGGDAAAVRMITLAPELPGAEALIPRLRDVGIVVSLGHSSATAEQTHCAADLGAAHVTHTFNAQPPLHHRQPGLTGAALTDERLYAELIADGVHLHRDAVPLLVRCKGAEKAVAITDAMEAAGMPEGVYSLGGQRVEVHGGEARLVSGTLAGSVLTMRQALENLIHRFGIDPADAVRMCTRTPAESIGEEMLGRMVPGSPAPLSRWSGDWRFVSIIDEACE